MKKTMLAVMVALCAGAAGAASSVEPEKLGGELEQIRAKARAGDYQAQRNLAYAYATGDQLHGKRYPVAGCAWYMSIPYLHSKKMHAGDTGNAMVYCHKLSPTDFDSAMRYSAEIVGAAWKSANR